MRVPIVHRSSPSLCSRPLPAVGPTASDHRHAPTTTTSASSSIWRASGSRAPKRSACSRRADLAGRAARHRSRASPGHHRRRRQPRRRRPSPSTTRGANRHAVGRRSRSRRGRPRSTSASAASLNTQLRGFYSARPSCGTTPSRSSSRPTRGARFRASTSRRSRRPSRHADHRPRRHGHLERQDAVRTSPGPARTQHTMKFATTPKMSSYLVAMAVGDFQCLDGAAEGVPIRICATPDKKDLGHDRARVGRSRSSRSTTATTASSIRSGSSTSSRSPTSRPARWRTPRRSSIAKPICSPITKSASVDTQQEDLVDARARDGAPVVRRSRDDGVVGRHLAERGVRDLDGRTSRSRLRSPSGTSPSTKRRTTRPRWRSTR